MKTREAMHNRPFTPSRRVVSCWLAALLICAPVLPAAEALRQKPKAPPPIKIGILSDLHLAPPSLGTSGSALAGYFANDPKTLVQSEAILDAAIDGLIQEGVDFVIVTGDLTKDGELLSHLGVAEKFRRLEKLGIQVYVVPGNHDINNPDAQRFDGDTTQPTPSITPKLFRWLYKPFGYGQAIDHAPDSLSYVVQAAPDLWLLALDSCKYEESATAEHPVVSGRLSEATMDWALTKLQQAQKRGKRVIAFMHHGVNLHFMGEQQLFPDFLVDDWASVSAQLAAAGLKVIFTGHYHSTDAAWPLDAHGVPQQTLMDVETASLLVYPSAYRVATLEGSGELRIETRRVTEIDADTSGVPFQTYSEDFQRAWLPAIVTARLQQLFPQLPEAQATAVAPLIVDAILANYAGDEVPSPQTQAMLAGLIASPEPQHTLGLLLGGFWTDLSPDDSEVVVDLGGN